MPRTTGTYTVTTKLTDLFDDEAGWLPPFVRIAAAVGRDRAGTRPVETIHPFLDGNGRIGRWLIAAFLEYWGLPAEPLMYVSSYLKQHQAEYYRRLSIIRTEGDWETWSRSSLKA